MGTRDPQYFLPPLVAGWLRWSPGAVSEMASAVSIRGCNLTDFDGRALPPLPELDLIVNALHCYRWFREPQPGIDNEIRQRVLTYFAAQLETAVLGLRARGLDLLWRLLSENDPDEGEDALSLALAVTRL